MSALHARLREATRDDHAAVERALRLGEGVDRDGLARALAALLGFFAPLEALLGVAAPEVPDVAARARAPALRADLTRLGAPPDVPACDDLPALPTAARGLGALYVLEGSLLGAPTVAASLARAGIGPDDGASAFAVPADEVARRWRSLLARLGDRPDADDVVAGARATFAALRRWVER